MDHNRFGKTAALGRGGAYLEAGWEKPAHMPSSEVITNKQKENSTPKMLFSFSGYARYSNI